MVLYAIFIQNIRTYTVSFYVGSNSIQKIIDVPYGGSAEYKGDVPKVADRDYDIYDFPFSGWDPIPENIQGDTYCKAQFGYIEDVEITDSWEEIAAACANGTAATKYKVGNYKKVRVKYGDNRHESTARIIGRKADVLSDGSGLAQLTWLSYINISTEWGSMINGEIPNWKDSNLRKAMQSLDIVDLVSGKSISNWIKSVWKSQGAHIDSIWDVETTEETIWAPSSKELLTSEIFNNNQYQPAYLYSYKTQQKVGGYGYYALRDKPNSNNKLLIYNIYTPTGSIFTTSPGHNDLLIAFCT